MSNNTTTQQVVAVGIMALSVIGLSFMAMNSFRLGITDLDFARQVNLSRLAFAASGGLAFAAIGAILDERLNTRLQVSCFSIVTIIVSTLLVGTLFDWPSPMIIIVGIVVTCTLLPIINIAVGNTAKSNLWLGVVLAVGLLLCVINFVVTSTVTGISGGLLRWLQGDLNEVGIHGGWCFAIATLLFIHFLFSNARELSACLLLGLGLGATGPIFFLALLVPTLIRRVSGLENGRLFLLCCGLSGALFVAMADTLPRLLIGGYAPSLAAPIALVSAPTLLALNRSRILAVHPSAKRGKIEAFFILLWIAITMLVFYHVVSFARLLS